MKEKDMLEKVLEEYNDVYADILNALLFEGEERVKPEDLEIGEKKRIIVLLSETVVHTSESL